jgi:DNA-binding CsgD family transcriptional regulator/tetratricopeptide (TPR) repeat protein
MATELVARTIRRGEQALRDADWEGARASFEEALAEEQSPEALEGFARASWWLSDSPGAISHWEQAYTAHRKTGDRGRAALVALLLAEEYGEARGNDAASNGWLARARDLVKDSPPSVEHGWVRLAEARTASDPATSRELAQEALDVARRFGDPDLELLALGRLGLAEIGLGHVEDGMTNFDQAMAAATAGEPRDLRTLGDLYCSLLLGVELTLDAQRVMQWNDVILSFMARYNHPAVLTFCGTCCAEVLVASGNWEEGEKWLTDTLQKLQSTGQLTRCMHPATRLASLRILQGRLEEAERLLEGYEDLPEAVQPMVSLYLARGQTALAAARLHRRLNQVGRENLVAVPLLAQLVDVQLAQGDVFGAVTTAGAIAEIAARSGQGRAEAEAALAVGSVKVAAGEPDAAAHLERAIELFTQLRLWIGAARAHLVLARSLAAENQERAVQEARQALSSFERLGATRDADIAAGFLREQGVSGRTGPKLLAELSKREVEVLRLLGEGLTNAEIAARLYISTKTVATHAGNIFAKLQLRNRAEAAAYAQRYLVEDIPAT